MEKINSKIKRNQNKKLIKCKICLTKDFFKIKTSCDHKICLNCLTKLRKPSCPFCRNDLAGEIPDNIINIINNNNDNNENNENNNNDAQLTYLSPFSLRIDNDGVHVNDLNVNNDAIDNLFGASVDFLNRLF